MTELKKMSDQELAARMVGYIERVEKLNAEVSDILNNGKRVTPYVNESLRSAYKELKEELKADAHYISLVRNSEYGNSLYSAFFAPSVREASAYGFMTPTNSAINEKFIRSIFEARYKLTKYHSLDDWKKIAQQ